MSGTSNFTVASTADLIQAINAVNAATTGSFTITLSTAELILSADLPAISLTDGVQLTIDGNDDALEGAGTYGGLDIESGTVSIQNLTIYNTLAHSDGGGLTLGGTASVVLNDVTFNRDSAISQTGADVAGDILVRAGGTLSISGGNLTDGAAQSSGGAASGILIEGTNTITFAPPADQVLTMGDVIADTGQQGAVAVNGAGVLVMTAANTYTGSTTIEAGTLALNGAGNIAASCNVALASATAVLDISGADGDRTITDLSGLNGSTVLLGNNTLTETNADDTTFAGAIDGAGGLIKNGVGTLNLSGNTNYNGATTINAGTLALFNDASLSGNSGVTLLAGTLDLHQVTATTTSLAGLTGAAGTTVQLGDKTLSISGYTFTTYAGNLTGLGASLSVDGGGTLTLSGSNSYTGSTTMNWGSVAISGAGSIANSTSVDLASSQTGFDISAASGAVTVNNLSGVDGATITLGSNTLNIISNASTGLSSNIAGAGSIKVSGVGTLGLSAYENYTGTTTIGAGTLAITGNGSIANSSAINLTTASSSLDISGASYNQQIQDLNGVAGSQLRLGGLTLVAQGAGIDTFAGVISGAGQFQQSGSGTLILNGNNTYAGGTVINSGTLQIGNGSTSGAIIGDITDDSALVLNRSDSLTLAGNITGSGNLIQSGTGITILTGDDRYSGATTVAQGTLQIGAGGSAGDLFSNVSIATGARLVFDRADTLGYYENITGAGAVADIGTGLLTLTSSNSYTGGTTIGAGTLELTNDAAAGTGVIAFTSGEAGTLRLDAGTLSNVIRNFTIGDTIDLRNLGQVSGATLNGSTLALSGANGVVSIQLDPSTAYAGESFAVADDGTGGTNITVTTGGSNPPAVTTFQGTADQYTVYANADGSMSVQDNIDNRDGTQTVAANGIFTFSNGTGLADPSGNIGDVARLYQAAFDRTPDLGGLEYWAGVATTDNVPLSGIADGFTTTPEFSADYGSLGNSDYVQALYENILHRAGESSGVDYWTNALNAGATRGAILESFAQSDENKSATLTMAGNPNDAEAYRLYKAALNRAPDQSGQDFWANALVNGASAVQVADGFVSSAEFQSEYGGLSTTDFVQTLYENVLGRAGDASGISYWTNAMNNGASQAQVVQSFADSAENRAGTAAATHDGWVMIANS